MTEADDAERRLGRAAAFGIPLVGVAATLVVGVMASFGSALLVLASTALLSTIVLLWASLRTLSGDAPLPSDLEASPARRGRVDALSEKKREVLRALKDMESERAIGKIDEADYADVSARYREEAKAIMREMGAEVAPAMDEAERVATEYLKGHGAGPKPAKPAPAKPTARVACKGCEASNEPDAAFCKSCGARLSSKEEAHAKA
jgi:hypothetical protein